MAGLRPTGRKTQILDTLETMLGQPDSVRITTAALAARLGVSEAALYRHFSGKTAMFAALIDQAEMQIMQDLTHIRATEPNPREQLRKHMRALLLFARRHPGLAKVLTGHALIVELHGLQQQANTVIDAIEAQLAQTIGAQTVQTTRGADQPSLGGHDPKIVAGMLIHWLKGCWQDVHSGKQQAAQTCDDELTILNL